MRHVLYSHDFEPITVIELERWQLTFLTERRVVRLPVYTDINTFRAKHDEALCRIVTITSEILRFNRGFDYIEHLMLFTSNEESAMLLKSAFLPGQRRSIEKLKSDAFAKGFLEAVKLIGR